MRLIHTESLELHEFHGSDIPKYAILSHRWDDEEITMQELQGGPSPQNQHKSGWEKLREFCRLAAHNKFQYAWMDTCCIDKTSSAELSEAINSMFRWYRKAEICYAYLNDVLERMYYLRDDFDAAFRASIWFTRGWTLQELLAPRNLVFISRGWEEVLGSKQSLAAAISRATGIPERYVRSFQGSTVSSSRYEFSQESSIAEIMSWASRRSTTREEDVAYSLMGLFGVQMPLLYGEGQNAFLRLQLEILKMCDDESIFTWRSDSSAANSTGFPGFSLLATSPVYFSGCKYEPFAVSRQWDRERPPYSMTNKGLRMEPLLQPIGEMVPAKRFLMPLNCFPSGRPLECAAIKLIQFDGNQFGRSDCSKLPHYDKSHSRDKFQRTLIFVQHSYRSI